MFENLFPFTHELRAVLETEKATAEALQQKQGIICPFVFHCEGKPIKDFRGAWNAACKNAGLPGRLPHDFRRQRTGIWYVLAFQSGLRCR
ncbi:MAG TPA: hypothetical protein VGL91_19320 [Acidobacteriota bacterium]